MISSERSGSRLPGRLVREDDRRIVHERAGDGDALLLPARQLQRIRVHAVLQPDPLQDLERAALLLRRRHAEHARDERDVLEDRLGGQQLEVLEDEPERAAVGLHLARRQGREVAAADDQLPLATARPGGAAAGAAWTCRRRSGR